ncbi:MAG: hypothetical protein ACRC2T_06105 [Thermoguttaceae bacterium]
MNNISVHNCRVLVFCVAGAMTMLAMLGCGQKNLMPETRIVIGRYENMGQTFSVAFIFDVSALNKSNPSLKTDLKYYWDTTKIKPLAQIDIDKIIANHEIEEFGGHGIELTLNNYLIANGIPACGIVYDISDKDSFDNTKSEIMFDPRKGSFFVPGKKIVNIPPLLDGKMYIYTSDGSIVKTENDISTAYATCLRQCFKRAVENHLKGDAQTVNKVLTGRGTKTRTLIYDFDQDIFTEKWVKEVAERCGFESPK